MEAVKAKKALGQHFLADTNIAEKIAKSLITASADTTIIEVGPGMGALTKHLINIPHQRLLLYEVDRDSVAYLNEHFPALRDSIFGDDFLNVSLNEIPKPLAIIGNFPYNISGPLMFKALENRALIAEFTGMFQKEVAERITALPRTKAYGIPTVLLQAWFSCEYLFTVSEHVFIPPPKVKSAVIRLIPKQKDLPVTDYDYFAKVVKLAFNQRRKTMRNSLRSIVVPALLLDTIFNKRPEELSWKEFDDLCQRIRPIE